jgi:hypothetical protein
VIQTFTGLRFVVISRTTQNEAHGGGTGSKVAFHPTGLIDTRRHLGPKMSDTLLLSQ